MLPLAVAIGMLMSKRKMMEVVSPNLMNQWNKWELRVMVIFSLTLQLILICLGNRRKYIPYIWIRIVVWSAYLMADAVAIYALGIISNKLSPTKETYMDASTELSVFWAPFLLLHLGGPDTITACAPEDNELWLRHLLSLVIQTGATLYIFLMAWGGPNNNLILLALPVTFVGLIKYSERVWVLRAASAENFRDAVPDHLPNPLKILEEYKLMESEGHYVMPHEVLEIHEVIKEDEKASLPSSDEEKPSLEHLYKQNQAELLAAKGLADIFQRLFADLLFSFKDSDSSKSILQCKHFLVAYRIIAIELGIIYDLLYTKSMAIHTRWGFISRVISLFFTCTVLTFFTLVDKQHISKSMVDLYISFSLLVVAILLELYAWFVLLFSDMAACWMIRHRKFPILNIINWLQPLSKRCRWSESMSQFSLISFSIKEKHLPFQGLLELLKIDENVQKYPYKCQEKVTDDLKRLIILHFTGNWGIGVDLQAMLTNRSSLSVERGRIKCWDSFKWSLGLEFDQSILIWHIATELCCHPEDPNTIENPSYPEHHINENIKSWSKISKHLSRYMLYLLVMHPSMLPLGIGRVKFRDTYAEAMNFFEQEKLGRGHDEQNPASAADMTQGDTYRYILKVLRSCTTTWSHAVGKKSSKLNVAEGCQLLRAQLNGKFDTAEDHLGKRNNFLFLGCRLAWQLGTIDDEEEKWRIISEVWVEMLGRAAIKCKGIYHAQQLTRGGELLTHVWFLLAHFGLTDHFQIEHVPEIVELIVK